MASNYSDPKDFALHISCDLLQEYLKKRHNLDFPPGSAKETRDDCAERFIKFMHAQEEDVRDRVFMELEYINSLSSENHIKAICSYSLDIEPEEMEKRCKRYDERALWIFTHFPDEFDRYYERANIEELGGIKEISLPKIIPKNDILEEKILEEFGGKVQNVFRTMLKGEKIKIKTFDQRGALILRIYLEDLPTKDTVFVGNKLDDKHLRKPVFDIIFIYNESLKTLGVRALGGKPVVNQLQRIFCSHFLGVDHIDTEEERYKLSSVKSITDLNLTADPVYGIERAYLKSVRLESKVSFHKIIIDVGGKEQFSGTDAVQKILKDLNLVSLSEWEPKAVQITVVFKQTGKGRQKKVTVTITPPNTCSLKHREQDNAVRKLLRDWGIDVR